MRFPAEPARGAFLVGGQAGVRIWVIASFSSRNDPTGVRDRSGAGNGFGRAVLAALVWAVLTLVITVIVAGSPGSARAAGQVTGSLLIAMLIAPWPPG